MKTNKFINRIGIIGEGVIGLSVATILQRQYPTAQIEITTKETFRSTTSYGAAGFVCLNLKENVDERNFAWYKSSLDHYWELYRSPDSFNAGITVNNLYYLSDKPIVTTSKFIDLFQGFNHVNCKELNAFGFSPKMKFGITLTSTLVEPRYYLQYLENQFLNNGGEIIISKLDGGCQNVANWALNKGYDVVINCSGLGAHELFDDEDVIPMRGQIIRVEAPWFKHSFLTTDDTYAFSCRESVVLGGFREKNDWDLSIRSDDTKDILKRIRDHNICLSESRIIEQWTGLRPWRSKLKLEMEYIESSSGVVVPIIHNYGHGSSGIGLSWGTSLEVADLMNSVVMSNC